MGPRMRMKKPIDDLGPDLLQQPKLQGEKGENAKTYVNAFNKSRDLWSQKLERRRIRKDRAALAPPKPAKKLDEQEKEKLEKKAENEKDLARYKILIENARSIKKKENAGGMGRGGGRGRDAEPEKLDLAARL